MESPNNSNSLSGEIPASLLQAIQKLIDQKVDEKMKHYEQKYNEAKAKGYELVSYISSKCTYLSQFEAGDNCFIFEDNTIQPFVKIGSNVTIWSGNHIGHHSVIENHNFISSHVVISGHCHIKSYTFLGVNSTIGHKVVIEEGTLLGAGVVTTKNTEVNGVYVPQKSILIDKKSNEINM